MACADSGDIKKEHTIIWISTTIQKNIRKNTLLSVCQSMFFGLDKWVACFDNCHYLKCKIDLPLKLIKKSL